MSEYLAERYFKCNASEKKYYFNLFLKAYFKEQEQKINKNNNYGNI